MQRFNFYTLIRALFARIRVFSSARGLRVSSSETLNRLMPCPIYLAEQEN
jgi:hypothetical protein